MCSGIIKKDFKQFLSLIYVCMCQNIVLFFTYSRVLSGVLLLFTYYPQIVSSSCMAINSILNFPWTPHFCFQLLHPTSVSNIHHECLMGISNLPWPNRTLDLVQPHPTTNPQPLTFSIAVNSATMNSHPLFLSFPSLPLHPLHPTHPVDSTTKWIQIHQFLSSALTVTVFPATTFLTGLLG